jgi:hypothetical protein
MATCSDVLEKCTASNFRVASLVQADAAVRQRKETCLLYRTVLGSLTNWSYRGWEESMGFKFSTDFSFFLGYTSRSCEYYVDGDCDVICAC